MTSGNFRILTAALLLLTMQAAWPADKPPDPVSLLHRLARPAPATTPFVEVRFSQLLDRPLVSAGTLEYTDKDSLVRTVTSPVQERTEIHGETVTIKRGTNARQQISLNQVPELRSLISGFAGLLSGDTDGLMEAFRLSATGDNSHWRLTLKPIDMRVARLVRDITVTGTLNEPACVTTTETNTNATVLLLQSVERVRLPNPVDRAFLDRYCADGHS